MSSFITNDLQDIKASALRPAFSFKTPDATASESKGDNEKLKIRFELA
jgi:hypothetical protein